jgi:hypothetical protein
MDTSQDPIGDIYDKAFANGRLSGHLDTVSALWDMAHEAYTAGDPGRERMLHEIAKELRERFNKQS